MSISHKALTECLGEACCIIQSASSAFSPVEVDGIFGFYCPISHPHINLVTSLSGHKIDGMTVDKVISIFKEKNLAFGWVTTPGSTPDLEEILKSRGMKLRDEMDGLAISDFSLIPEYQGDFLIREVRKEEKELFWHVLSEGMSAPLEMIRYFGEAISNQNKIDVIDFLTFKGDQAVAAASMVMFRDRPIVKMSAATVLESYRHQGIYKGIIARRIDEAKKRGAEAAIVLALKTTSSPICQKVGFKKVFGMKIYAWEPGAEGK